jgi:hypothetical protein
VIDELRLIEKQREWESKSTQKSTDTIDQPDSSLHHSGIPPSVLLISISSDNKAAIGASACRLKIAHCRQKRKLF